MYFDCRCAGRPVHSKDSRTIFDADDADLRIIPDYRIDLVVHCVEVVNGYDGPVGKVSTRH